MYISYRCLLLIFGLIYANSICTFLYKNHDVSYMVDMLVHPYSSVYRLFVVFLLFVFLLVNLSVTSCCDRLDRLRAGYARLDMLDYLELGVRVEL